MSTKSTPQKAPSLDELPFDFTAFLTSRLGISEHDAEKLLGGWMRELDRARHGFDRFGSSESPGVVTPLETVPWRKAC